MRRFLWVLLLLLPLAVQAEMAASIVFSTLDAVVESAKGVARPAAKGGEVDAGETIDTRKGRVQLAFRDGASMALQPDTRFKIDAFKYSGGAQQATSGDGVAMTLAKGALRTATGWLGKSDRSQYRLGTSVATIGIRGTEYGARLDNEGLLVSVYEGAVEVCSTAGCLTVPAGRAVLVRSRERLPQWVEDNMPGNPGQSLPITPELGVPAGRGDLPSAPVLPASPAGGAGSPATPATASAGVSGASVSAGTAASPPSSGAPSAYGIK